MLKNANRGPLTTNNLIDVLNEVNVSSFSDQFGPEEVIQVYDPEINMHGILVIDNTALGPGKGCIKLSPDITPRNIFLSARASTWKCALVEIPFGGAKAGIRANPNTIDKVRYLKSFGKKIAPFIPWKYIASPDINTTSQEIASFIESINDRQGATGKPEKMGGIPDNIGTSGFGIGIAIDSSIKLLSEILNISESLDNTKVIIQGWNDIALALGKYLSLKGALVVAIKDNWNTIFNPKGLDIGTLKRHINPQNEISSFKNYKNAILLPSEEFLNLDSDVMVLCDTTEIINGENWDQIKPRIIIEGKNNIIPDYVERNLFKKGTWVIPDILATSGGIISSYVEYIQKDIPEAFAMIESKVSKSTKDILSLSFSSGLMPRLVAQDLAQQRIIDAMDSKY